MNHVMLDLETLATTADAAIMSVGAVVFDPIRGLSGREEDKFYASISVESNLALPYRRRVDESTLQWWLQQGQEAQAVFHEPKQTLDAALFALADWMADVCPRKDLEVWAKPSKFDIAILEHAYRQLDSDTPWEHWSSNCLSGLVKTARRRLGDDKVPSQPKPKVHHNALHDAVAQAQYAVTLTELMGAAQ